MSISVLTELELFNGIITIIYIVISIIIGIKIASKYFTTKRIDYLTIGLSWIFLSSAWWASPFSILVFIFFNVIIEPTMHLFIAYFFFPFALIFWAFSIMHLFHPSSKKIGLLIVITICILYEIALISFLLIDPSIIGTVSRFHSRATSFTLFFQISALIFAVITGIYFSLKTMRLEDNIAKIRGKFLFISFLLLFLGSILDSTITETPLTLLIIRLILIASSIGYYLGFFLPLKFIKV